MPQAFLGSNPGTSVRDVLEVELHESTVSGDVAVSGNWKEVNFPMTVAVLLELGAIAAGVTGLDIEVVGADDTAALNQVSYGRFAAINGTNDDEDRVLTVDVYKPFMGVIIDYTGSGDAVVDTIAVIPKDYRQGNTRTA